MPKTEKTVIADTIAGATPSRPDAQDRHALGIAADVTLVRQCVAGDVAAWEYLIAEYQPFLTAAVASLLRAWKTDVSAAEDVIAKTWLALVDRDGELFTKYDPERGVRLRFFLLAIAKDLARRHLRTEARHSRAQGRAEKRRDWYLQEDIVLDSVLLSEFWGTLTDGEQAFFTEELTPEGAATLGLPAPPSKDAPPTRNAAYCLRHRVRKKFLKFFGFEQ